MLDALSDTQRDCKENTQLVKDCVTCYTNSYNQIFSDTYQTMCPLKTRRVKPGQKVDWISPEIKKHEDYKEDAKTNGED